MTFLRVDIEKLKTITWPIPLIWASFILVLAVKVTHGLDFTDEMQYYGEIKGLTESGRLFTADLFLQQTVYILFYPLFWVYHKIFEFQYLVYFGRLLLAGVVISIYVYVKNNLQRIEVDSVNSNLIAFAVTFAIPYHGIFALSYNTISQALWAVFVLRFLTWPKKSYYVWSVIWLVTGFAHQTSAAMMLFLVLFRLIIEKEYRATYSYILSSFVGSIIAVCVYLLFADTDHYVSSLKFSSAFGVGDAFLSNTLGAQTISQMVLLLFAARILYARLNSFVVSFGLLIGLAYYCTQIVAGSLGGYTYLTVRILMILCAIAYALSLINARRKSSIYITNIDWFVFALLCYAVTLGITSGNGIGQSSGALLVGLPVLVATASIYVPGDKTAVITFVKAVTVALVSIALILFWTCNPYRDQRWYSLNSRIPDVAEFKGIYTSESRKNYVVNIEKSLKTDFKDKRVLVAGGTPALYFILHAAPETCMFFLHSLPNLNAEREFQKCMEPKNPEKIMDFFSSSESNVVASLEQIAMQKIYAKNQYKCTKGSIDLESNDTKNNNFRDFHSCSLY